MNDERYEEGYEAGWRAACSITDELLTSVQEDADGYRRLADRLRAELAKAVGHAAAVAAP